MRSLVTFRKSIQQKIRKKLNMIKKTIVIVAAFILCISLCACGNPQSLKEALTEQATDYVKSYATEDISDEYTQEDVIIKDISKYEDVYTILGTFTYVQDGAPLAAPFKLEAVETSANHFKFEMIAFLTTES